MEIKQGWLENMVLNAFDKETLDLIYSVFKITDRL